MKKLLIVIACALVAGQGSAQSFFKALPKREQIVSNGRMHALVNTSMDSTMNAIRPIANIAAYAEPGNILMAGAGISYQHLKWNISTSKWNCQWSISGLMWAGGSVAPSTPTTAVSYGLMFGFLNNLIMVGPAINNNKVIATISIGINFNN